MQRVRDLLLLLNKKSDGNGIDLEWVQSMLGWEIQKRIWSKRRIPDHYLVYN